MPSHFWSEDDGDELIGFYGGPPGSKFEITDSTWGPIRMVQIPDEEMCLPDDAPVIRIGPRRGERKGQLRYYLRATAREPWGRKWNRFWASRWFWSAGRLGPVPHRYEASYWGRDDR